MVEQKQEEQSTSRTRKIRRWGWWIGGILVVLGVAGFLVKDAIVFHIMVWRISPHKEFSPSVAPAEPDYNEPESWAALPTVKGLVDSVPQGVSVSTKSREADVFFIHPTTYFNRESWNAPLTDPKSRHRVDVAVTKHQASAFNACCRVYAPRYRQATLAFAFRFENHGKKALKLAYLDVVRAFQHYMKHWNQGRPFILAGHSQGTMHALRLLEEHIVTKAWQQQLVAAYLVGNPVHLDKFSRTLRPLKPCQHAKDTRCVISWITLGEKAASVRRYSRLKKYYHGFGYEDASKRPNLCTNPLSWETTEKPAPESLHLGAIPYTKRKEPLPKPKVGIVSGVCRKGGLRISKPRAEGYRRFIFGKDDYHIYDYHLFYMNIRQNALDRVQAFLQPSKKP